MGVLLLGVSYFIHFLGVELEEVGDDFVFVRVGRKAVCGNGQVHFGQYGCTRIWYSLRMGKSVTFFAFLAVAVLMAGRADGVFISPRHSQVEMKCDWYPELQRAGKEKRCHWMSGKTDESVTLRFEGTSVAVSTRTGARVRARRVTARSRRTAYGLT